jgi:hypothetical protein
MFSSKSDDVPPPYPCPRCRVGMHWAKHCPVFPGVRHSPARGPVPTRENVGLAGQQFPSTTSNSTVGTRQTQNPHGNLSRSQQ